MGREIRRVPPNWEHPMHEYREGQFKPLYEGHYPTVAREWVDNLLRFERGEEKHEGCDFFWEWEGMPPEEEYHVPYNPADFKETGWWQAYETVSEGTPVSPPFATAEELISYLSINGDFWAQRRGDPPPSREAAGAFVRGGWVPSMILTGGKCVTGIDIAETFTKEPGA